MHFVRQILIYSILISLISCGNQPTRPVVRTVVVPFGSDSTSQPATVTHIIGSTKSQVDMVLQAWEVRVDRTSTQDTAIYRYTLDVTFIVAFRNDQAIGVYVIDNPGMGVTGIPPARVAEIRALLGADIDQSSILTDASGIREFGAGDITSW